MTEATTPELEREYQGGGARVPETEAPASLHADSPYPADTASPDTPVSLRRRVVNLAAPVIGENLLETMLGIIDTFLVAGLGAVAIAGVGGALQLLFFLISVLSALAIGSSVLVAQAFGAQRLDRASELARQSLIWSGIFSVPLAIGGYLIARPIMGLFSVDAAVINTGTAYLHVTMALVVVFVALFIGGGVLRGVGDSRTPMVVTAIANVINVVLAYGLIYGHLALPALGAVGSAWAAFLGRSVALALLVGVLWRGRYGMSIRGKGAWRPDFRVARDVLWIGVPAALEQVVVSIGLGMMAIIVAHLGTSVLAAHRISIAALSFSFLPGIGFGIASTALVGQSVGARHVEEGRAATRIATLWAVSWMTLLAAILFLFARPIMGLFTSDLEVQRVGSGGLRMMALTQPFWAVSFVQSGALRGLGNTRFPLMVTIVGMTVSVALGWLFVTRFGGGLAGVWAAWLVVNPFSALALWFRFKRGVQEIQATVGRHDS